MRLETAQSRSRLSSPHLHGLYSGGCRTIPSIVQSWRRSWIPIIPFFDYPPERPRIIDYPPERPRIISTNAIEPTNMPLRNISKNRRSFPSNEASLKLFTWRWWILAKKELCHYMAWMQHGYGLPSCLRILCQIIDLTPSRLSRTNDANTVTLVWTNPSMPIWTQNTKTNQNSQNRC